MENQGKFSLDHYYRDLEAVQKTITTHKNLPSQRPKTFLKHKSQLPIRANKKEDSFLKKQRIGNNRLSLNPNTSQKRTPSETVKSFHQEKGVPLKYLQDIQQSYISQNSSFLTQSENHKIILQIHGMDHKDQDEKATLKLNNRKHKKEDQKIIENKLMVDLKSPEKQQTQLKRTKSDKNLVFASQETVTEEILQNLRIRNRIYEMLQKKCNQKQNLDEQFKKMWKKYQAYQKVFRKFSNFLQQQI